jgi:DNA-binding response OmpR family regulator
MNRDSWAGATHQNHYISSRHVEGGFGIHFAACMRVLVIDDNDDFRKLALLWFQIHGIEAEGAANGVQGLEFQRRRPASVIVTDIFMPEKEGIETIQDLRREFPEAKIIAMTGRESLTDYDVFQVARELGAVKTFKKPFKLDDLVAAVRELTGG